MGKITGLPQALSFDEGDVLVKDGEHGTKQIPVSEAAKYMGRDTIMVNEQPTEGTKVVIQTTGQEYSLALMSDVNAVDNKVDEVKTQIKDTTENDRLTAFQEGYISFASSPISFTPTTSSHTYNSGYWACNPGDVFTISGTSYGTSARLWGFVDENRNVLLSAFAGASANKTVITAPEGTAYIVLNDNEHTLEAYTGKLLETRVAKNESDISSLEAELENYKYRLNIESEAWENKGILPVTGEIQGNSKRLLAPIPKCAEMCGVSNGYSYVIFAWDDDEYQGWYNGSTFVKTSIDWSSGETAIANIQNYSLFVVVRYGDGASNITPEEGENFYIISKTDPYFNNKNAPANSFAVGERFDKTDEDIENVSAEYKTLLNVYNSPSYYSADDSQEILTNFAALIALYDNLVTANPNYITKNTLTSGNFSNYEYVFTMGGYNAKRGQRSQDTETAKPVVLIMSGVHGHERCSITGLYLFCKALCENPAMSALRESYEIHVIPVVCPWGFDHNSRVNENGVNINRNFDADWVLTPDDGMNYSGAAPADQDETKVVQNWMDAYSTALFEVDWHNSGFANEICYFAPCISTGFAVNAKKGYFDGIAHILEKWIFDREITGNTIIYSYTGTQAPGGQSTAYAKKINLQGTLFETSWNVGSYGLDSKGTVGVNAEAFSAMIKGVLSEIS